MKYQSKKDGTIFVEVVEVQEKYGTTMLKYLTGEKVGKEFPVTNATLKRWYTPVEESTKVQPSKSVEEILNLDFEKINEPYPEPKKQKYIPKPQSVIDYENRSKRQNNDLPSFEKIVDTFAPKLKKINEKSGYVVFFDKTALWRRGSRVDINAPERLMPLFSEVGLIGKPNKDKDRPIQYQIKTIEDYKKAEEVLLQNE